MTTLYDIGRWYENRGLVGEKRVAIVQTAVAISGKPMGYGLIASAGSGKTATMDLAVGDPDGDDNALIKKKFIAFKDAASEKAVWYDKSVGDKPIMVYKELQKDNSQDTIEAIKSMTEGKSARRLVTVAAEDRTKEQKIGPKTVLFTYAIENKDVKTDAELMRRCITMSTDISKEQTAKVLSLKARLRWDKNSSRIMSDEEADKIRQDVNSLIEVKPNVANPFAEYFSGIIAEISPDQKIRSMAEHFWDVMEGIAKINWSNDPYFVGNGDTILANIQDLYQTLDVYKSSFLRDVHSIPPLGDIILQGFDDSSKVEESEKIGKESKGNFSLSKFGAESGANDWYDVNHIRKAIKQEQKVVLAKNVVIQICRQLVDAGYLEDWKDGATIKYQVQEKFRKLENPDPQKLLDAASKLVKDKFPEQFERWYEKQKEPYIDPITGEKVWLIKQSDEIEVGEDL